LRTTLLAVLLISLFAQISTAQTSTNPSSAPQPSTAPSHKYEIWVDGGWSVMSTNAIGTDQLSGGKSNDLLVTNGALVAVRFDWNQSNHFGHEFQYVNARMPIQYTYEHNAMLNASLNHFGYNLLGYFNGRDSKVRFFGTLGGQLTNYTRPSSSELGCVSSNCSENGQPPASGGNSKFGGNYGLGVKVRVTPKLSLRSDFRQYVSAKPFNLPLANSGPLIETEVSAGFGIAF
jgi:hypothetical protein